MGTKIYDLRLMSATFGVVPESRASESCRGPPSSHEERRFSICLDITTATSAPNPAPASTKTSH